MTREELFTEIKASSPEAGDLVYIERRGKNYAWSRSHFGTEMSIDGSNENSLPDAWIYYTVSWPSKDKDSDSWREFFDDLIAEMESMTSGADRCRWPIDEPWPQGH